MAVKTSKVWSLEKYARFVPDVQTVASAAKDGSKAAGQWQVPCKHLLPYFEFRSYTYQHYPSRDMKMQLSLLESDHFVVSCGAKIHVRFVAGRCVCFRSA